MVAVEHTRASESTVRDLRDWLARVEAIGQLHRVPEEVDWDLEMGTITYLLGKQPSSPAVLFENVKDYGSAFGSLWNQLQTFERVAISFEEPPDQPVLDLIQAVRGKLKRQVPPLEVDATTAPVNENVLLEAEVDLERLPAPRHWPLDGGRYLGTADAVITRDPQSGVINVGTYRMMVQDRNHLGLYLSPGKDARLHLTRAWQRNEALPIAVVVGGDPLLFLVGSQAFPKNRSEYDFAGGIKNAPIEVIAGPQTGLPLPARAELVLEGVILPHAMQKEGPFGEFTGYYGRPEADSPLVEITAMHYRHGAILANELMTDNGQPYSSITRSARIWDDLDRLGVPGIKGVFAHPMAASSSAMHVISLEQRYAGHAPQVLALAAQCPAAAFFSKWIITVDEDVDPTDINQVLWAISTRCNPVDDIDILRDTWSTWLDPTQNPPDKRPYGSKALINACMEHRYLPVFSKRARLDRARYEQVAARWQQLRLPGQPPRITAFEETSAVSYHEAQEPWTTAQG
ncbi:MAG TPA: UbiD family decarboxylase [Chloroflexota bacterium]